MDGAELAWGFAAASFFVGATFPNAAQQHTWLAISVSNLAETVRLKASALSCDLETKGNKSNPKLARFSLLGFLSKCGK